MSAGALRRWTVPHTFFPEAAVRHFHTEVRLPLDGCMHVCRGPTQRNWRDRSRRSGWCPAAAGQHAHTHPSNACMHLCRGPTRRDQPWTSRRRAWCPCSSWAACRRRQGPCSPSTRSSAAPAASCPTSSPSLAAAACCARLTPDDSLLPPHADMVPSPGVRTVSRLLGTAATCTPAAPTSSARPRTPVVARGL